MAYGLSLWGAYICWEQEEEEIRTKKALRSYLEKYYGGDRTRMLRDASWAPEDDLQNQVDIEM